MIDKISSLYCYIIKRHVGGSIDNFREALLGIIFHLAANDENGVEMHKYCQVDVSSFCQHNRAVALGKPTPLLPKCISTMCKDRILEILAPYYTSDF